MDIQSFNSIMAQASRTLLCDDECQNQKTAAQLKQNMNNAKFQLKTAPAQWNAAEKKYVTYAEGDLAYQAILDAQIKKKTDQFLSILTEQTEAAEQTLASCQLVRDNAIHVKELDTKLKRDNAKTREWIRTQTGTIQTNERKSYYENDRIDYLNSLYYYGLLVAYIIGIICLCVFLFIKPTAVSIWKRGGLVVLFIILPFIASWLLGVFIWIVAFLYSLLPANIYMGTHSE
jgi:hypothetical protein